MPRAERTVTINRPVDEVFRFVADGRNAPHWRSGVLDVALVSGDGLGARYSQGVRGPGGRRIAADYEITEYEPDAKIGFRATAGPVRPTGSFTFESMGAAPSSRSPSMPSSAACRGCSWVARSSRR